MALTKTSNQVIQAPYKKNVIINGDFKIWQRGTSLTGINTAGGGKYLADRFQTGVSCDAVVSAARSTSVPTFAASGRNWPYSHYVSVTTADTSIGANQFAEVTYKVEGYDVIPLMGRVCTLSFWSAATKTGTYCVALRNNMYGPDRSYILEYNQAVASTWQFNQLTFTMHDGASGTWDFTNGMGLDIWFMLACGSTYQTTPNAWQTGNYIATSNQTNLMDTIGNNFWLTGVQLELGPTATPFENRPFAEELALCLRYYYAAPAAIGTADATSTADLFVQLPVPMRIGPTVLTPPAALVVWDGQVGSFTQSSPNAGNMATLTTYGVGVRCANFTGLTLGRVLFLLNTPIPLNAEF